MQVTRRRVGDVLWRPQAFPSSATDKERRNKTRWPSKQKRRCASVVAAAGGRGRHRSAAGCHHRGRGAPEVAHAKTRKKRTERGVERQPDKYGSTARTRKRDGGGGGGDGGHDGHRASGRRARRRRRRRRRRFARFKVGRLLRPSRWWTLMTLTFQPLINVFQCEIEAQTNQRALAQTHTHTHTRAGRRDAPPRHAHWGATRGVGRPTGDTARIAARASRFKRDNAAPL